MADDSALIVVAPGDSVDAIIRKIRGAEAQSVQLLVPDGTPALQALGGFARLRESLERDQVDLLVISSDEKTLNAARLNQLTTLGVEGAQVAIPADYGNGDQAERYATQVLPREQGTRAGPIDDSDAEFLDALDQMSPEDRYVADEDADLAAALDDLSSAAAGRGERDDDEFAAALDEWSTGADGGSDTASEDWETAFSGAGGAPRRRVRPEDLEVSAEESSRQRGARRTAARGARADAAAAGRGIAKSRRGGAASARLLDLEEVEEQLPRRGLGLAIPLLILLLIIAIAAFWYFRNRVMIVVTLPSASTSQHPFEKEVIPLASGANKSASAIQAIPIGADAEFSVQGQVVSATLTPAGTAKGIITIYNSLPQDVNLPQGTEFIATNQKGSDVHFTLDTDATVPRAVTNSSPSGSSTVNGKIDVAITARSPGSNSNVGENTIKQIIIPGQPPIANGTTFTVQHGPITGGDEKPVRVVTDDDVQRTLQEVLTGLYNVGVQALGGQIDARTQAIDPVSVYPDPVTLGKRESYDIVVNPPVGQPVDPNNSNFTVVVKRHFTALATPREQLVSEQLATVVPEHFRDRLPCKANENLGFDAVDYHWDGKSLTVDGTITCAPSKELAPETASRVKRAVSGMSRAEAEKNLKALEAEGLIGGYALPPDREQFPGPDFLLTVEQGQPAQPQPTPAPE
jgi:hypothetical protein